MPIGIEEANRRVRFGATIAAMGHAMRLYGPVLLLAWIANIGLGAIRPLLTWGQITVPPLPFGPATWSLLVPLTVLIGLLSGLLIRWLLAPAPLSRALRVDAGLAAYTGLIVLTVMGTTLVNYLVLGSTPGGDSEALAVRGALLGLASIILTLIYALLALWPVSFLAGEPLSPLAATARMGQAYFAFLGLSFLLILPASALIYIRTFTSLAQLDLLSVAVSATINGLVTVLQAVLLAQIYSRRVRGCDLGETPPGSVGEIFA